MGVFDFLKSDNSSPKLDGMNRFKFKDIKFYCSTQGLANSQRKYRQVFEQAEISYIYVELSLYNKLFDEQDWHLKVNFKVYDSTGNQMTTFDEERDVTKDENVIYVRSGWGKDKIGSYWTKGSYRWEAWYEGKKIAEKTCYVINEGPVLAGDNPYFKINSLKLFEASKDGEKPTNVKYLGQFDSKSTRYVWVEFEADNTASSKETWPCELLFNFYSDTGELKGQVQELIMVQPDAKKISCETGWGTAKAGWWLPDNCKLDVVFMDQLVGTSYFDVGDGNIEASDTFPRVTFHTGSSVAAASSAEESLEDVLKELDTLIGLASVKKQIHEYARYLQFIKLRKDKGFDEASKFRLHSIFTGNPGTGKTTIARMLGKIYRKLGLLTKGHVHEVDRADIIGEYIGQTAPKVKAAIQKAHGGILFIDEAYSLARKADDKKDFGHEALEILIKEMSDGSSDLAVVVAGYPAEMKIFIESNPGLESRFNNKIEFPDYLPQELMEIALFAAQKRSISFAPEAKDALYLKIVEAYRGRDKSFGNARFVYSLVDEAKMNMGLRLMDHSAPASLSQEELSNITKPDIDKIADDKDSRKPDIPVDEFLLRETLDELKSLVGLEQVKAEIDEMVKLVKFYRETGRDALKSFSLHSVFMGNPGTGKTTVARLIAQIYRALGILERGHLVECDREQLIAGYVGQTTHKTADVVNQAMGGVLFIDEAYSLDDSFGKEALEIVLKRMEDKRGEFAVIVAGYTKNMEHFLDSNPGLRSRFDRTFQFDDYDPDDLIVIADKMLAKEKIKPDAEAQERLKDYFAKLYQFRDDTFGNAREVRKVIEEAVKNQNLRLADLPKDQRTETVLHTLTLADVMEFDPEALAGKRGRIGFVP